MLDSKSLRALARNTDLEVTSFSPPDGRTKFSVHRIIRGQPEAATVFVSADPREVRSFLFGWIEARHAIECNMIEPKKRLQPYRSW